MTATVDDIADFAWRAHPAREHAGRAVLAVAVIGVLAAMSTLVGESPWWALGTVVLMVFGLNRFFFPSRFEIDDDGITAVFPLRSQRFLWVEGRRFVHGSDGGLLSTRTRSSRFEPRASMHVLFGRHRDAVVARIREHLHGPDPREVV